MTAADTTDFSDRPWMDSDAEPAEPCPSRSIEREAAAWRMGAHGGPLLSWVLPLVGLNLLIPLLIWRAKAKPEGDHELEVEAVEALNFQINVAALSFVLAATILGLAVVPVLWIVASVYSLIAAIKSARGVHYRYPCILRPVKID